MIYATAGGVTVGLCLLIWQVTMWWPGRKALLKDPVKHAGALLPFLAGWTYGVLGILTTAGLVAMAFDVGLWLSNWLGDAAGWLGVGAKVGVTSQGAQLPLSGFGSLVVLLLTAAVVAAIKKGKNGGELKRGVWCGACLGTSSSVAGLAAVPLAQGANWLGDVVYGSAV